MLFAWIQNGIIPRPDRVQKEWNFVVVNDDDDDDGVSFDSFNAVFMYLIWILEFENKYHSLVSGQRT